MRRRSLAVQPRRQRVQHIAHQLGAPGRPPSGRVVAPVEVNGGPVALYLDGQQQLIGVWALDIARGQITSISAIDNPDKLTHLGPLADFRSLLRSAR